MAAAGAAAGGGHRDPAGGRAGSEAGALRAEGHLDQLIPVMNKLQDVFSTANMSTKMDLPQIAVVGAQSSGKSSVIENIVGRDFLPRGAGIVTRRPLRLQLRRVSAQDARKRQERQEPTEWAEFLHKPQQKYTDFSQVRQEIEAETDRLCGRTKNVRPEEISLTIFSDRVVDLTLIDLPGLTKVAVQGQPEDVARQIEECVLQWIAPKNTIILAISAANTDIANSDAINIARRVDPQGDRTLGVLTKLDLMDRGTDAMDTLTGQVVRLKKGFIGIVNRSQADIDTRKSITESLKAERRYFQEHPSYSKIADKMGTMFLVKTLNKTLLMHIKECLPALKNKIQDLLDQTERMFKQFSDGDHAGAPEARLLHLLTHYSRAVATAIDGTAPEVLRSNELVGGARINYLFSVGFVPFLSQLDPLAGVTEEQVRATIHNCQGTRNILFIPEQAFETLSKAQIGKLEPPAQKCIDYVFEELHKICEQSEDKLARFPTLKQRINDYTHDLLLEYKDPACKFVSDLIRIEQAYINTNHPDFFGGGTLDQLVMSWNQLRQDQAQQQAALAESQPGAAGLRRGAAGHGDQGNLDFSSAVPQHIRYEGVPDDKERREHEVIKHLVSTYFGIVRKHVQDHVPKAIMCFMVNKLKTELHERLVQEFYKQHLFEELLHESEDILRRRKAAESMHRCLSEAMNTLTQVREFRV